jgi:hypothetical protein
MTITSNGPFDYQAEVRRAAGMSVGVMIAAAAVAAVAVYITNSEAKAQLGPTIDSVDNWLKNAAKTMRSSVKSMIEEIDSAR